MLTDLPIYVYITFFIAIVFSLIQFYKASKSVMFIIVIISWGILHSILAFSGFYENTKTVPPRFAIMIIPMVIIILSTIFSKKMQHWLSTFNLKQLMYLHSVRILVELVLFWLFIGKYVPKSMTFEGSNFDILAGITALIIAHFSFRNNKINKMALWIWHIFSILLLVNVLIHAILSTPTIFQQFAFEQPNIAVMKFPFLLLPAIIVPIVLISNMAGFIILKNRKQYYFTTR